MRRGINGLSWMGLLVVVLAAASSCHVFDESDPVPGVPAGAQAAGPATLGIYLSSFETDPTFDPLTFDQEEAQREGKGQICADGSTGDNGAAVEECPYEIPSVSHPSTGYNVFAEALAGEVLNLKVRMKKLTLVRREPDGAETTIDFSFDGTSTPVVDLVANMHSPQQVASVTLDPGEYVRMTGDLEVVDFDVTQGKRLPFPCDDACNGRFQCNNRSLGCSRNRCVRFVCYRARCVPHPGTEIIQLPIFSDQFVHLSVDGSHGFNRVIELEANATCTQDYPGDPTSFGDGVVFPKESQVIPLGPFG